MKTMRQDAWTAEDDAKLADIILRHIREGSTQLAAFEEGAQVLKRTPAACGYRWNACVRKQFLAAINMAKLERKEHRDSSKDDLAVEGVVSVDASTESVTWNTVFRFLRQYRHDFQVLQARVKVLERDWDIARIEVERLRRDKTELIGQLRHLSEEHQVISEDYRALLNIVDRARKRQLTDDTITDAYRSPNKGDK